MEGWSCISVLALLLLFLAASHGRELHFKNEEQRFVYNHTLAKTLVKIASTARESYGDINFIVTCHSMGGAMASFCALDLAINLRSDRVQLITFGQPRVGNAAFASCFAKYVPNTIRITHGHDIVPHLPPYFSFLPQLTYHHFPRVDSEGNTIEQICDDSGEDPDCCRCVSMFSWELIWKCMIGALVESSRCKVSGSFKRSSPTISS